MRKPHIAVRTRAVIFKEEDKLLVQHNPGSANDFFRLPGVGVKFREKLDDCVTREIEEETGLDIEVTRLLWVRDFLDQASGHSIEFFFLATRIGGKFMSNVEASTCEFSFLPLEELSDAVFYPKVFIPKLKILRDNRNWAEENPYVRTAN